MQSVTNELRDIKSGSSRRDVELAYVGRIHYIEAVHEMRFFYLQESISW